MLLYKVTSPGRLEIPDVLTVKPSMKIDHKLINSFFQMSDVDVQYIQFDIKMKAISFTIISTSCVYPIITASSSLLSFERDQNEPFALSINNLTFSSFTKFIEDFESLKIGKEYLISMQHSDQKYYKFFYLICPFYKESNMETVIRMASILSTEDSNIIDLENNQKYPVEFNSTLSLYQFFENCLLNVQVKKIYLNTLMFENKSNTFLVDFTQTSKYLLLINKSKYLIQIYTTDDLNYKIIKATSKKAFNLLELKKESKLDFNISEDDVENSFYIYIEKLSSAEKIKLYIKTYNSILEEGSNFFHNFWGYFIVVLASIISLVIVWIIVQRFMNKKRLKKIQQDLDSKLRQQHTHEIQKQSERISVFMMGSKKVKGTHKLTRREKRGQSYEPGRKHFGKLGHDSEKRQRKLRRLEHFSRNHRRRLGNRLPETVQKQDPISRANPIEKASRLGQKTGDSVENENRFPEKTKENSPAPVDEGEIHLIHWKHDF